MAECCDSLDNVSEGMSCASRRLQFAPRWNVDMMFANLQREPREISLRETRVRSIFENVTLLLSSFLLMANDIEQL